MSLKSIIASVLVLGTSTVALAAPDPCQTPAPAQTIVAPVVRPIEYRPVQYRPVVRPMPPIRREVTLGVENQRWFGNKTFEVGAYKGQFQTLKLETDGGKSFIDSVKIKFADGRSQTIQLDKDLGAQNPCLMIDLAGNYPRAIQSVTVRGANARRSAFSVVAV
jgi:hypothetical protein